jgi:four helix bundle protein
MYTHRSLRAWQESQDIVLEVVEISRKNWQPWAGAMFSQLQRSSLSVQLNLAEGYAYGRSRTTLRFWRVAYGSAIETGDLLRLLGKTGVIDVAFAAELARRNDGVQRLVWGLITALKLD